MSRAAVEKNGFEIVSDLFNLEEISSIGRELDSTSLRRTRAGIRHLMSNSDVAATARDHRLLEIACETLGGEAFPFRATLFDKSPDANWLVVWHQDTALQVRHQLDALRWGPWSMKEGIPYAHAPADVLSSVLALRVHLDDSTADNGPLKVLPGTHSLGLLDDDRIHPL